MISSFSEWILEFFFFECKLAVTFYMEFSQKENFKVLSNAPGVNCHTNIVDFSLWCKLWCRFSFDTVHCYKWSMNNNISKIDINLNHLKNADFENQYIRNLKNVSRIILHSVLCSDITELFLSRNCIPAHVENLLFYASDSKWHKLWQIKKKIWINT